MNVLAGIRGLSIITSVSKDLLFKATYSTSIGIMKLCKYMMDSDKPYMVDVNKMLCSLDINAKITVLHELIKEREDKKLPDSVKKALEYVSESLDNMHKELNSINKSVETHNAKWFNSYRTMDCTVQLTKLEMHNSILDIRVKRLFDLLKISN